MPVKSGGRWLSFIRLAVPRPPLTTPARCLRCAPGLVKMRDWLAPPGARSHRPDHLTDADFAA